MKQTKKPPIFNNLSDIVDMFFDDDGCCRITNNIPYFGGLIFEMDCS